ncbi:MAG: DoxX family protein [Meiothermus sp.]|nr:DoxX family protein [Meiothermus sp.]
MIDFFRPNFNIPGSPTTVRLYWVSLGLFTLLYLASLGLTFSDLEASYKSYTHLGFSSMWIVFFNGIGKVLGLLAIYQNKSRTLKDFAFAGFLFNLLLALSAHIAAWEADVVLPIVGLVLWAFAFTMYRRAYPVQDQIQHN